MRFFLNPLIILFIFWTSVLDAKPLKKSIQSIVKDLSSAKYEGRETGKNGSKLAAEYIDSILIKIGYTPSRQSFYSEELKKNISNIITQIEGKDTNNFIIIGAHYDGLGIKNNQIYPGADDNATGVAAVFSLAKMFKDQKIKPSKTIIFAFWDCEEENLNGSNYFVSNFYKPSRISLYMNFDMVGRANQGNVFPEVSFAWNNNFPYLKNLCEKSLKIVFPNKKKSLDVTYETRWGDGKGGSDYAAFSKINTPFIAWMEVDMHADYHKPTDTSDKISWKKLERVIRLSYVIISETLNY